MLVTILNKAAFAKVDFKYPYALSTVHMACNIIGAQVYFLLSRTVKPKQIEGFHRRSIIIFSFIFSLNIAMGNTSLRWVSVNFNQVCRALVPVIVMGISMVYYKKIYTAARQWAVIPIVAGVALAFYGDLSFTNIGAFYTMLCVVLAALKAIVGGELLTGDLKLHEIDLLSKVCPLALMQIGLISVLTGEVSEIYARWDELSSGPAPQVVLLSGLLSFSLNVSNFIANKVTSPLTLCIAANVKQVRRLLHSLTLSLSLSLSVTHSDVFIALPSPAGPPCGIRYSVFWRPRHDSQRRGHHHRHPWKLQIRSRQYPREELKAPPRRGLSIPSVLSSTCFVFVSPPCY